MRDKDLAFAKQLIEIKAHINRGFGKSQYDDKLKKVRTNGHASLR